MLLRFDIAENFGNLHSVVQHLSQHNLKICWNFLLKFIFVNVVYFLSPYAQCITLHPERLQCLQKCCSVQADIFLTDMIFPAFYVTQSLIIVFTRTQYHLSIK
jgi:hypothetical protein